MPGLDPRIHPFRDDIAAEHLRDRISADRYVSATRKSVVSGSVPLRRAPRETAPLDTELLHGEAVDVYEEKDGWSWLQAKTDGYVGFTPSALLGAPLGPPTHIVAVLRTYMFPIPDPKTPPIDMLSMNAALNVCGQSGAYCELAGGGWVYSRHLASVGDFEPDPVAVAVRFLGTPYLWGGKTSVGLDCSGLIQLSLARCGLAVLRDTAMQESTIGESVDFDGDESVLARSDLIYWPDHAGIWIDTERFVHANATDMMVSIAPLREVAAYIAEATGDRIRAVRRPVFG